MKRRLFSRGNDAASPGEDATTSLRPAPPIAKRLNRNALTVAAVVMGMTVLTAIVVVSPSKGPTQLGATAVATDEVPPPPPRPSFLDQPARVPPTAAASAPVVPTAPSTPVSAAPSPSTQVPSVVHSSPASYSGPYDTEATTMPSPRDPSSTAREAAASQRERSYQAALASSVVVGGDQAGAQTGPATQRPTLAMQEEQLISLGDSVLRASMQSNGNGAKSLATPSEPSNGPPSANDQRASFSDRAAKSVGASIVAQLEPASTAYALRAGTVIPGLLITSISSELPGEIVGQVSRDVYDSRTQRTLLIPKGSRLIGSYDNQVAAGQGRLLVAWTRLLLPDGRSMRLPGLALADRQGNAGAKGNVDNHWRRVFGNALLLSAIGAGVQLSQPAQASVLSAPSPGQVAAGAVGRELSSVALEILRRGMDVKPTISIPAGQPFNVLLSGDLLFDEPYTPHG